MYYTALLYHHGTFYTHQGHNLVSYYVSYTLWVRSEIHFSRVDLEILAQCELTCACLPYSAIKRGKPAPVVLRSVGSNAMVDNRARIGR